MRWQNATILISLIKALDAKSFFTQFIFILYLMGYEQNGYKQKEVRMTRNEKSIAAPGDGPNE